MGDRRAKRADQHRNMLLVDESSGRRLADLWLAGVVGVIGFDGTPEHAARLIDLVKGELSAILFGLPAIREWAAEYRGDADPDRFGALSCAHRQETGEKKSGAHRYGPRRGIIRTIAISRARRRGEAFTNACP